MLAEKLLEAAGNSTQPNYIEDVFSTYLYTGTGSAQTITNGINLSTNGGLIWTKGRTTNITSTDHWLVDTARGTNNGLRSNSTGATLTDTTMVTGFNSNGYSLGSDSTYGFVNYTGGVPYVSWTFRKQAKFFDIQTVTADSSGNATFSHNLGSTPGCVILKRTDSISSWYVWHRSLTSTNYSINLHGTGAQSDNGFAWITPNSTTVSINGSYLYPSGSQWVAYLFAHDAGGFGLTGTDNVISCGSFTTDASGNATVNLGYEPQWLLTKVTDTADNWVLVDTMRGWTASNTCQSLRPNTSGAEISSSGFSVTSTGFTAAQGGGPFTYIYIAIRRGPMKVPTTGTSVFNSTATTGSTGTAITTNFPVDLYVWQNRDGTYSNVWQDRLRGIPDTDTTGVTLTSQSTLAEQSGGYNGAYQPWNTGLRVNSGASGANSVYWNFRRAPGFFDEVCYTGDGTNGKAYNHNLTVVPQLIIIKSRSDTSNWKVLYQPDMRVLSLNTAGAYESAGNTQYYFGNDTVAISPTSTQFTVSNGGSLNLSGSTYVAYLFATCAGVSKVGSYTGDGTNYQDINCGFTSGARFVMIKRVDASGDWYVFDTARGITTGADKILKINSTAAEITSDEMNPYSAGFSIGNNNYFLNVSGGTYIFLAIA